MYQFIETIKFSNSSFELLPMHLHRIESTCLHYYGQRRNLHEIEISLSELSKREGLYKVTVYYNFELHEIKIEKYKVRTINYLKIIADDDIDYSLKYANRNVLEKYKDESGIDNDCIILKNNRITDTSFSNLIFFNGKEWHTPLNPLLHGIKRKFLLQSKKIAEKDILLADLRHYEKISLINTMLDTGEIELDTNRIIL